MPEIHEGFVGPPMLGTIEHPGLNQLFEGLYWARQTAQPNVATEVLPGSVFLSLVDADDYAPRIFDSALRAEVGAACAIYANDIAALPSEQLSPWEQSVRERVLHDVNWYCRLLKGLGNARAINTGHASLQNRVLAALDSLDEHSLTDAEDQVIFQQQLSMVPRAFEIVTDSLRADMYEGDTMPYDVAAEIARQLRVRFEGKNLGQVAVGLRPPGFLEHPQLEKYSSVQDAVARSYFDFYEFLVKEYMPACYKSAGWSPRHFERYDLLARYYTDDDTMTPTRIGRMALEWFGEAEEELRTIWREEFPEVPRRNDSDLSAFLNVINQGPSHSRPVTQQTIEAEYERLQAKYDQDLLPRFPEWVARMLAHYPLRVRVDTSAMAKNAFPAYRKPALDPQGGVGQPGTFISPVADPAAHNWNRMGALLKHEGAHGGHHLQFLTMRLHPSLPLYLQHSALHPLTLEAYSKYFEGVGEQDRWQRAAASGASLHEARVLRLDYLYNTAASDDAWLEKAQSAMYGIHERELLRVKQDPAAYVVYQLGRRLVEAQRQRAERELGANFSEREFHGVILREGPLPPAILAKRVEQWIALKQQPRLVS